MITIILEKKLGEGIEKISKNGNESYLCQEDSSFQKLSEIDNYSYSTFSSEDMDLLEEELTVVYKQLNESKKRHIEDILELIQKCKKNKNSKLSFTPFED